MFDGFLAGAQILISYVWPLVALVMLWRLFEQTYLFWRQEKFRHDTEYVVLELRIPREVTKSPKAMEQVLSAIHFTRNAPAQFDERWIEGENPRAFSLEMVSLGGEVHFYVRIPKKIMGVVEASFFSYYPDVEVIEVPDYIDRVPRTVQDLKKQGYETWGVEMILAKDEAYPIKSYLEFESPDENKQYDPISTILEVMAKAKKEEVIAVQINLIPCDHLWAEKWKPLVKALTDKKSGGGSSVRTKTEFPGGILPAFTIEKAGGGGEADFVKTAMRSPGETDVLKAVETNLSKQAFETVIRFAYFAPEAMFYYSFPARGLMAAFNQYSALNMNTFIPNARTSTKTAGWVYPHIFPKIRSEYKKQRFLYNYARRTMPVGSFIGKLITSHLFNWNFNTSKSFRLSIQSVATVFHPPTFMTLTAPHMKRVESKKAGPPAGLAIYGEEEEIEKYK